MRTMANERFKVTKALHFCYGHRLMNYDGKCRHLHGHNGRIEIELSADNLDSLGMVRDFTEIKDAVASWVDRELDHKMLLRRDDPVLPTLQEMKEPVFLFDENPTAEAIAKLVFDFTRSKGFPVTEVRLWESDSSFASYGQNNPES